MDLLDLIWITYFALGISIIFSSNTFIEVLVKLVLFVISFFFIIISSALFETLFEMLMTNYKTINQNVNFKLPFKTIKNLINALYNTDNLISCDETELKIKTENKIYKVGFKNRFDYCRYIKFVTKLENEEENAKMAQEKQEKERKSIESLKNFSDSLIREYSSYDFSYEKSSKEKNELMIIGESFEKSKRK